MGHGQAASSVSCSGTPPASALFHPTHCDQEDVTDVEPIFSKFGAWTPMIECPAYFSMRSWLHTMHEWIQHPERNSSSILRGEIWQEYETDSDLDEWVCRYQCVRRILPRRTHIDRGMLQECAIYTKGEAAGIVVYTTLRSSDPSTEKPNAFIMDQPYHDHDWPTAHDVPYYHPVVRRIAFRYTQCAECMKEGPQGHLRIDFSFFPDEARPIPPSSRLGRTAISLLRLLHQHGYGHATAYVKRVHHDILVPRDLYQDVYLALRTRYAGSLIASWAEVTDPTKHVFEDLGIAAWLILLWRDMFPLPTGKGWTPTTRCGDIWGQPPGGFFDVGCGNGLLVHILHSEGYNGCGQDARARKSWAPYVQAGTSLREGFLDGPSLIQQSLRGDSPWPDGVFLIGNHADELTPWIPVLAASLPTCSGFVNIPCCAWMLNSSRFTATQIKWNEDVLASLLGVTRMPSKEAPPSPLQHVAKDWETRLQHMHWFAYRTLTPPDGAVTHSKHLAYYTYIATLHLRAGWCLETEALRIPSTKNWAFVGRRRLFDGVHNEPTDWKQIMHQQQEQLIVEAASLPSTVI